MAQAIPRYRSYDGPALLAHGFRPFFLGAGLWAWLAMLLWSGALWQGAGLPTAFPPSVWHGHAMIFGFAGAAMAGFLTTAVPNWTGRMPIQGWPLGGLALLWVLGRLACLISGAIGPVAAMLLDLAFFVALTAAMGREIAAGRNWRNLPVLSAIAAVGVANLLVHLGPVAGVETGYGLRLGAGTFAVLIALIGGRITPSFTRNWLAKRKSPRLPAPAGRADKAALALTPAAMLAWTLAPAHPATGVLAALAAGANLVRLARWRGMLVAREPLLLVLHAGYAWLVVALAVLAAPTFGLALPLTGALHLLTVGAFGTMILAVMTRATRGHTGRELTADAATTAIFVAVGAAALLRLAAPLWPSLYLDLLAASALVWIAAFVGFSLRYGPMLVTPRK